VFDDLRSAFVDTPSSVGSVTIAVPEATVTFGTVTSPGITTITPIPLEQLPLQLPGAFNVGGALFYELSTTATVGGSIDLCFTATQVDDPASFGALFVLHLENGQWTDRTTSRDFESRKICASTSSLSPFAIARLTSPTYSPQLLYTTDRAFKAGSTAPLKVQVLDWSGKNVSSSSIALKAVSIRRTSNDAALSVEDSGNANPDSTFRYDSSLQGYVFNLSIKGYTAGTYSLTADVGGQGRYIQLPFSVR
jgi:hypothetical protein